ncbi:Uu.00g147150.m01.CDS01 [Anthostomella pinea]|uniref:Uu.00g147150.m01.CDS01 n=1 Tax=Anthostomella pinea TaxID=933095 RepID=A0AAI8VS71_9PEZI|nr:Uu.00g147150.m01.CDS01 [Anthostomella pinea]
MASLYDLSIPVLTNMLACEESLLKKAEDFAVENKIPVTELLEARIHDDMLPLGLQIVITINQARRALETLTDLQAPALEKEALPQEEYHTQLSEMLKLLSDTKPESIKVQPSDTVSILIPTGEVKCSAVEFVTGFTLPNAYFHVTTMYDILRMKGVPLGKKDYLMHFLSKL